MTERHLVGAYWGPRKESVSDCAQRLAVCLDRLERVHPVLGTWFRKGRSRTEASKDRVTTENGALEALLAGGRNRTDVGHQVISELGFRAALWNGQSAEASFSVRCGAYPSTPDIKNRFVLKLPKPEGEGLELYAIDVAREIFRSIVEAWEPDWASFMSDSLRAAQGDSDGGLTAGWMTYVNKTPEADAAAQLNLGIEPLAAGVSVVASENPLDVHEGELAKVRNLLS